MTARCELCAGDGGRVVWRDPRWRVVRPDDALHPATYRVVCNEHVVEFGDLPAAERARCMEIVVAVEQVLRERLRPTKVNLASLGNLTPHLHWHAIARFDWDSHFPQPVWAAAQRVPEAGRLEQLRLLLPGLDDAVRVALG